MCHVASRKLHWAQVRDGEWKRGRGSWLRSHGLPERVLRLLGHSDRTLRMDVPLFSLITLPGVMKWEVTKRQVVLGFLLITGTKVPKSWRRRGGESETIPGRVHCGRGWSWHPGWGAEVPVRQVEGGRLSLLQLHTVSFSALATPSSIYKEVGPHFGIIGGPWTPLPPQRKHTPWIVLARRAVCFTGDAGCLTTTKPDSLQTVQENHPRRSWITGGMAVLVCLFPNYIFIIN